MASNADFPHCSLDEEDIFHCLQDFPTLERFCGVLVCYIVLDFFHRVLFLIGFILGVGVSLELFS